MASDACCTPAPPSEHISQGVVGSIGGLSAYLHKPSSAAAAIILVSDIFGCDTPLLRKLADKVAAAGFFAVVPDYFKGDPFVVTDFVNPFSTFGPWITVHHPDGSVEETKTIVQELKDQGFKSVGISGFCWGAKVAVTLASEDSLINAAVLLHPSLTTLEDIKVVKKPLAILAAEIDQFTPPSLVEQFKEVLDTKHEVDSFVKIFPGQKHGWCIRYDVEDSFQVTGAEEAQEDMLTFYKKNL